MRKLTRKSLDELAKTLPVIEESFQMIYVGGGNGTSASPYTQSEYNSMVSSGMWNGGYVEDWGYTFTDLAVTSYDPDSLRKTGVSSYDLMYASGFEIGFNAGLSRTVIDDIGAIGWSFVSAASAGSDFGDVDYDMIHFSEGIRDGLKRGREARGD